MLIGIDFDNTIVCYDRIFHRLALNRAWIDESAAANKGMVRDSLRQRGREKDWTLLQGEVYGRYMPEAEAYPGFIRFLEDAVASETPFCIISHRTKYPYLGSPVDLHRAAQDWLKTLHEQLSIEKPEWEKDIFFELTKAEKLARISAAGCTHFIDDLPELLTDPAFPHAVEKILFDPNNCHPNDDSYIRIGNWTAANDLLLSEQALKVLPDE